jgi:hypothetical protein
MTKYYKKYLDGSKLHDKVLTVDFFRNSVGNEIQKYSYRYRNGMDAGTGKIAF